MRVTIIGIGNVGCALAVDLESRGHTALLWADPAYRTTLDTIRTAQQLSSIGIIAGTFRPQPVESLEDAIASSKIVIIATPSTGHDSVLVELAKHDLRAHTVIAISGNFFSLVATKRINARAILETVSSPFGCRLTGDGQTVFVKSMKARLDIAAASRIPDAALQDEIGEVFRAPLAWCANAVELALMCFNGVIHPAAALLNVARIETAPDFFFYCEGMSRSVTKVQEAVDAERIRIANALGFAPEAWLQAYKTIYGTTYPDVATLVADRTIAHNMTKGAPKNVKHRYFTEDIPYLLVPWVQLGALLGVPTPNIHALIVLASSATETDFMETGRNLKALGLDTLSRDDFLQRFSAASVEQAG